MSGRESRFRGRRSARLRAGRLALLAFSAAAAPAVGHAETINLIHQHLVWDWATRTFQTVDLYTYGSLPADQAFATPAEIMTRPAMGAVEDGYRLATLPLRWYVMDSDEWDGASPGRDWFIRTAPTPPEPYPAFARRLPPGGGHGTVVRALAVDPSDPATVYAYMAGEWGSGYGDGMFKTTDGGGTWAAAGGGLPPHTWVGALAVDPSDSATVYAGTSSDGVFKTTDGAGSWTMASAGLTDWRVNALAMDPSDPETLYAGTHDGVFKTTDGAGAWAAARAGLENTSPTATRPFASVYALAVAPSDPATIYAGTYHWSVDLDTRRAEVFKTTDGGGTWTAANAGLPNSIVHSLAVDPSNPVTVYARSNDGVFKTTDGGGSWTPANAGLPDGLFVRALAVDPSAPATVYAGTDDGVFKTTDGAGTWTAANTGLEDAPVTALAVDPWDPATVYAGTTQGVFKTTDGGGSWASVYAHDEGPTPVVFENAEVSVEPRDRGYYTHGYYDGAFRWDLVSRVYSGIVWIDGPRTELRFGSGWTIVVEDGYPVWPNAADEYGWPASVTFISPDGDRSKWDEWGIVQADGSQVQELPAAGRYTFTIWPEGQWPAINVRIFKERVSDGGGPPPWDTVGVLTDLLIETDGAWRVTFGRNAEVRVKADDWQPAAASLVAYSDDRAAGPEAMGPSRVFFEEAVQRRGMFWGKFVVDGLAADELLVDFGRVARGESWTMPLYIFNGGEEEVDGLELSGPDDPAFSVEGDPEMNPSLAPGGWAVYDLRFEPPEAGSFDATMTTAHGLAIRLTGRGIILGEGLLDVDGNGKIDALTDGLMVLRHLFGFEGAALTTGAVADDCVRCDAEAIEPCLRLYASQFDVDGDGESDALTDGLLILRYLFGFRGASLTAGVLADDCTRCDPESVEARLAELATPPAS